MNKIIIILLLLHIAMINCFGQSVYTEVLYKQGAGGVHTYRIPAIIKTLKGTLLVFAEARNNSRNDTGDIDLVLRRSEDKGKTWSEVITVWDDEGNVCGNPCPVVDVETGRIVLLMTWNNGDDTEAMIKARLSKDTRRIFMTMSDDDGITWTEPEEITDDVKKEEWTWYATGPCHGIQISHNKHKGRLIIPCNHGIYGKHTVSHVIISDDGGLNWKIGGIPDGPGNESTVTELKNGDILLNMRGVKELRDQTKPFRLRAVSKDGGLSFVDYGMDEGLIEPVCSGSIINYRKKGKLTETLLFSNPNSETDRIEMTIKKSDDSGKTWEPLLKLSDYPAAYSDLAILDNGDVAIVYETGEKFRYASIVISVIPADMFVR